MTEEVRVLKAPGTGEDPNVNMLSGTPGTVLNAIREIRPIGLRTYQQSMASAIEPIRLFDAIGPWVGYGYSLGAAMLVANAPNCHNLKGLVLLGNPFRWGTPMRHGIAGRIGLGNLGIPVIDLTIPNDPISDIHADNGARQLAVAITGRPQGVRPAWANPIPILEALNNYGPAGRHTAYSTEKMPNINTTYTEHANTIINNLTGRTR